MRRVTVVCWVALFSGLTGAFAGDIKAPIKNYPILTGNEPLPAAPYYPSRPGTVTDSPGDTVGWTQYDYQTNGSTGNRAALAGDRSVHFVWTGGAFSGQVGVYYNRVDSLGNWLAPGTGVLMNRGGYPQISVNSLEQFGIAFHRRDSLVYLTPTGHFHPPNGDWPYVSIDRHDRVHIVMTTWPHSNSPALAYTRSNDGGTTWTSIALVDTLTTVSGIITSSRVSDKVAIIYTHPFDTSSQWINDVFYIQSEDGMNWDWANGKVNVTHYGTDNDSLCAYTDCDAVYDGNDNLHIIWNATYVTQNSVYFKTFLFHYDTGSGRITEITHSDSAWSGCDFGGWTMHFAKMSIAARQIPNQLFVTYTDFDSSDCSASGYANGDIYMHYSEDGGATWSPSCNLTNSRTPNCVAGECDSDHWSTLAETVDDYLHIFYVNDKDAGGIPQTEGTVTDNPMLYLRYPNPILHVHQAEVLPKDFTLYQNYPNPFNATTTIPFELKNSSDVRLAIYDVSGALVKALATGRLEAGSHRVIWDAGGMASGVYYCRLTATGESQVKKMILMK